METGNKEVRKRVIKEYDAVKVGDMAFENPVAGGNWDNEIGRVLWVGTFAQLEKDITFKHTLKDWEPDMDKDDIREYDLVVVDVEEGPCLFNYNNDPSGVVVFTRQLQEPEQVDHPNHYGGKENPYEAIKVIEAWELDFCLGNAIKYICRAGKKEPDKTIEDLEKAQWYLQRKISQLKSPNTAPTT